jgi:hypothetical protein
MECLLCHTLAVWSHSCTHGVTIVFLESQVAARQRHIKAYLDLTELETLKQAA